MSLDPAALQALMALLLPGLAPSPAALAARLRAVAASLDEPAAALLAALPAPVDGEDDEQGGTPRRRPPARPFDFSAFPTCPVALELFYAGWPYHGFASQGEGGAETVETHLFAALKATRLVAADATWASCGYSRAGRTDRGVSAVRQLVALTVRAAPAGSEPLDYVALLNRRLPADIRVLSWRPVGQLRGFSARFSATWRQYKYYVWDDGALDLGAMRAAAARFVGTHDFRNLCRMDVENVRSFVRTITSFTLDAEPGGAEAAAARGPPPPGLGRLLSLNVRGSGFLYHQVRCMAAVLLMVGRRQEAPAVVDWLLDVQATPRKPSYTMAPEEPLLFCACGYDGGAHPLPPPHRAASPGGAKARALAAAHLRSLARRAAVRAAVAERALSAVLEAEAAAGGDCRLLFPPEAGPAHVPLAARQREASYEELVARLGERRERREHSDARAC